MLNKTKHFGRRIIRCHQKFMIFVCHCFRDSGRDLYTPLLLPDFRYNPRKWMVMPVDWKLLQSKKN